MPLPHKSMSRVGWPCLNENMAQPPSEPDVRLSPHPALHFQPPLVGGYRADSCGPFRGSPHRAQCACVSARHAYSSGSRRLDGGRSASGRDGPRTIDLPARNADDMLRKIMGYTINGDHDLSEGDRAQRIFAEARALLGMPA